MIWTPSPPLRHPLAHGLYCTIITHSIHYLTSSHRHADCCDAGYWSRCNPWRRLKRVRSVWGSGGRAFSHALVHQAAVEFFARADNREIVEALQGHMRHIRNVGVRRLKGVDVEETKNWRSIFFFHRPPSSAPAVAACASPTGWPFSRSLSSPSDSFNPQLCYPSSRPPTTPLASKKRAVTCRH